MRTFGTATLIEGNTWRIRAEPHVAVRLKRIFDRAVKVVRGELEIRSTDETCRDLLWALKRYPLELSELDHYELEQRARAYDQRVEDVQQLLLGKITPRPFELALPPRGYQTVATEMLLRTGGLLIADDVGLGKTLCAIAALTQPAARPALVVTLTHLTTQWEREIHRFAPSLRTHILRQGKPYDVSRPRGGRSDYRAPEQGGFPDVLITNYHKLAGWSVVLSGAMRTVVFDECQELRRGGLSQKYRAAVAIMSGARYRVGLSATPIYNYGGEFFHVMECLRPGELGTSEEFLREWCETHYYDQNKARIRDPRAFGTYVREVGLMLRRTRAEVGRELPEVIKVPQYIDADERALESVSNDVAELARIILDRGAVFVERGQAARQLDSQLRQATGIAKAPFVAEFVRLLLEAEEKIVLYGWHRSVYDIWRDRLGDLGPVMFTGSESPPQKEAARRAFIDGNAQVLLMSLRAGAGLDGLQDVCRTVVFGELDWSPGVHEQCIGRVHRDSQGDAVAAYYLLADSGSDPVVADVLGVKKQQIEGLRDPSGIGVEVISRDEDGIRRLAEEVLRRRGESIPQREEAAAGVGG